MGGVVERQREEGTTDVSPEIRGKSFRNRIMASCLNAPQIVCQVTAALNRDTFIGGSGEGRMQKQQQQRLLVLFAVIMI